MKQIKNVRLAAALFGALSTLAGAAAIAGHFPVPNTPDGTVVLKDIPVAATAINVGAQWRVWGNYFYGSDGVRYRSAIFEYGGVDRPVAIFYQSEAMVNCRLAVKQAEFPDLVACEEAQLGDDFLCMQWYPERYDAYYAAAAHCSAYDQTIYYFQH
jgi:hypothetical protein